MVTAKEARAVARQMLRENKHLLLGSYLSYFGLTLAVVLAQFLFLSNTLVTTFWSLVSLFLLIPLTLGILHIHNMIYYKRRCSVGNLFDFYRNYPVSLKAVGVSYLFSMILSAILMPVLMMIILPLSLGGVLIGANILPATLVAGILLAGLVSILLGLLAESFVMSCYFIVLRNRSIRFGQLLGSSFKIGGRYMLRYFLLQLSFFGWGALCSLLLFVPLIFSAVSFSSQRESFGWLLFGVGLILFGLAMFALSVYINAASTVFFNVAIDEYEQQYPDLFAAAPHIPHAGSFDPQQPADRYASPAPSEAPKAPQQPEPAAGPEIPPLQTGSEPEKDGSASEEEPVPEKVDAEVIEPQDGLCDVILISAGVGRMLVLMIICEITGMEHDQARQLIDNAPKAVCIGIPREEAHEVAKRLTEAGAQVEIR